MDIEPYILGQKLRLARKASGLNLELGARGICSPSYLSLVETGRRVPSEPIAKMLMGRFGLTNASNFNVVNFSEEYKFCYAAIRSGDFIFAKKVINEVASNQERSLLDGLLLSANGDQQAAVDVLTVVIQENAKGSAIELQASLSLTKCLREMGEMAKTIVQGETLRARRDFEAIAPSLRIELLAILASAYIETGDLLAARQLTNEGQNLATSKWDQAMGFWSLARLEESAGRMDYALNAAEVALSLIEAMDQPATEARMLNVAAFIELQAPNPNLESVGAKISRSEILLRDASFTSDLAACLSTKADWMSFRGDIESTRKYYEESLNLLAGTGHELRGRIIAASANSYLRLGLHQEAKKALLEARECLSSNGASRGVASVWRSMADLYEELNEETLALACMKAATDVLGISGSARSGKLTH